ncbi:amino acid adenylation domain-containing protein [Pseudomonas sp. NFACC02]|uniref:non-ribosomal peptide synthetase n=1 Tax=Pseudomonas sp. NFACC02 TaxID=1566250 RepID=UPI0008AB83C4|nr:non-ribosomal peptide synthetase [Pseudomonas sp. NFACC02]SEQ54918.1 amino acid adenylation domain-containing protein [Pseudomonas sp. NFACC02]
MKNTQPPIYEFRPSSSQRSLWHAHQMDDGAGSYNISHAWRMRGPLDITALSQALNNVVHRHEILRTRFRHTEAGLVQQILTDILIPVQLSNIPSCNDEDLETTIKIIQTAAQQPFDLSEDPLIRAYLFKGSPDDHIFMLSVHHIIVDGWSMDILWGELEQAYEANRAGLAWNICELPLQYADYAEWQNEWLTGQPAQQGLKYWVDYLRGSKPNVSLPSLGSVPKLTIRHHHADSVRFKLPNAQLSRLNIVAREHRSTLFVTLFAAFHALLFRLSQQDDICVGYPVANRRQSDTQSLIGCFVNTLVLRTRPNSSQTFSSMIEQVRDFLLQGEEYQEAPFEKIVQALHPERSAQGTPLFQIMFSFQDKYDKRKALSLSEVEIRAIPLKATGVKFDLCVDLTLDTSGLNIEFQYDEGVFARDTIARSAGHFEALLTGVAAAPTCELRHLPLTRQGQELPMSIINQPAEPIGITNVVTAFELQANLSPAALALVDEDGDWTYARLNQRANKIAMYLSQQSLPSGAIVAVLLERSGDLIAALLGIMKAGCAYLPLDPLAPSERVLIMLNQSNAAAVITVQALSEKITNSERLAIYLENLGTQSDNSQAANLNRIIRPGDLAYCLFTSGSTGLPKGVLIEHEALANLLSSMAPDATTDKVWLSVTSPTFDVFAFEVYLPLVCGAAVVLTSRANARDPIALTHLARTHGVTAMFATPATWRMFIDSSSRLRLRTAFCGGESMDLALASYLQTIADDVWNLYGPTETTVLSTRSQVISNRVPVLGRPINNTQVLVLDNQYCLVPVGVAGDIYITGNGLARGYVNQPGLTAEKFLPNPFGEPGSRMYRTGDLGYINIDGMLVYLNRTDFQVKIRGVRIELAEIEAGLRGCPQVRDAVVIAVGEDIANRRLVAYVVATEEKTVMVSESIMKSLRSLLPAYMLPTQLHFISEIPLNVNGKIDRNALPRSNHLIQAPEGRLPSTPTEIAVAEIWQSSLGVKNILADDNFFSLGGNSMLAIHCLARINERFSLNAKASLIFNHQTITYIAEVIDARGERNENSKIQITSWFTLPNRQRVYGFPAAGMYGAAYYNLACALAPEVDLCMLEPIDWDDHNPPIQRIDELAEAYTHKLTKASLERPLYILGHSFGGSVAFEVAKKLEQNGLEVFLILLDATVVSPLNLSSAWDEMLDDNHSSILGGPFSMRKEQLLADANAMRSRYWEVLTRYNPSGQFGGDVLALFAEDDLLKLQFEAPIVTNYRKLMTGQIRTSGTPGKHLSILEHKYAIPLAQLIKSLFGTTQPTCENLPQAVQPQVSAFQGMLPTGVVIVEARDPTWWESGLMQEEEASLAFASAKRRREFSAGRNCVRAAMEILGLPAAAIPVGEHRQPLFPKEIVGSITHSDDYCAAAVVFPGCVRSIGIDAEADKKIEDAVARRVLSGEEIVALAENSTISNVHVLAFSLKEAFFKAIFPLCQRYVGFKEVAIRLRGRQCHIEIISPKLISELAGLCIQARFRVADNRVYTAVALVQSKTPDLINSSGITTPVTPNVCLDPSQFNKVDI